MQAKVNIDWLELEITRKCNIKCAHCIRGEAQNIDMTPQIIQNIFENNDHVISSIHGIVITGGEPLLNKEGLIYLLEYLLIHQIPIKYIEAITNGLIYDKEVTFLLQALAKKDIHVNFLIRKDQFHPPISRKKLKDFLMAKVYSYCKEFLNEDDIIRLGRAFENNLGDEDLAKEIIDDFKHNVHDFLTIQNIVEDKIDIGSLYVTAKGHFGTCPPCATWDMIDEKYKLDIRKDSLFTNCMFAPNVIQDLKEGKILLPTKKFQEDFRNSFNEGHLDLFLHSLNTESIREYLTNSNGISRKLQKEIR